MTKKKILAILQLPPPKHGASFVGQQIKDNTLINEQFDIVYIRISTKPKSGRKILSILKPINFLFLLMRVFRIMVLRKFDLIYITPCASGLQFYKDFVICMLAKIFNSNVVYHFHNKGIQTNKFLNTFVKEKYFQNANVILLSELLKHEVESYVSEDRIFYCANGVSYNHKEIPQKRITNDDGKKINILFLSNMMRTKGVFVLLEACSILKDKGYSFHCQFVGPWYEDIEQEFFSEVNRRELGKHVQYLGAKYGVDKENVYKASDVFVFPTYLETFGLVNIEAMSYGLPVISTSEGAIPEVVRDGIEGFVVEKENANELANRLEILLNDRKLLAEMSERAKVRYQENYTEEHFVSKFVETINQVVEK